MDKIFFPKNYTFFPNVHSANCAALWWLVGMEQVGIILGKEIFKNSSKRRRSGHQC